VPQIEDLPPVRGQVQAIGRDRWAQRIAAQALEPRPIPRRHDDGGMEIETVPPCVAGLLNADDKNDQRGFRARGLPNAAYHYFVRLIVVWLGPAERRGLYFFGEFCTLRG